MDNKAAWITGFKSRPLKIDTAPYTKPGPGQLVIKNVAVAINPVDWKTQVKMKSSRCFFFSFSFPPLGIGF